MKYGVNKNTLLLIAGMVWFIAGTNIFRVGIITWYYESALNLQNILLSLLVFLLFFCFIFRNQFKRHSKRINKKARIKNCPFSFFDVKGWFIMIFMIAMGMTIRRLQLLPPTFISIFYTGLSVALMLTGLLFIRSWWNNKRTNI